MFFSADEKRRLPERSEGKNSPVDYFSDAARRVRLGTPYKFRRKYLKEIFMKEALKEAKKAFDKEEVPVGAVIVKDGK